MAKPLKRVLITDLDNTLFDWVDLWYHCFSGMLNKIVEISGIPAEQLKPAIKRIHRRHGTSEYSFLIEEIPQLKAKFETHNLTQVFSPAIEAYQAERRKRLALYPHVAETLLKIRGRGALIIGYTESMAFYSNYRMRRLGLDGVIEKVFSPHDHDIPTSINPDDLRKYPASHYAFKYTIHTHTPRASKKPDVAVLEAIILDLGVPKDECAYVGDSLFKDMAMAQDAGVTDVWAKYGQAQQRSEYNLLREVTHWTDEDVEREKQITQRDVNPGITLSESFGQLLDYFEFGDLNGTNG
jgi:FMN phosphatase YigB (HAD superfamily)